MYTKEGPVVLTLLSDGATYVWLDPIGAYADGTSPFKEVEAELLRVQKKQSTPMVANERMHRNAVFQWSENHIFSVSIDKERREGLSSDVWWDHADDITTHVALIESTTPIAV